MNLKQKILSSIGTAAALVALVVLAGPSDPIPLSGYVAVKNGGTGVQTLTGIPRGNGTSAFTVATGAQIASSFTGTCDATTFLRADGACVANSGASLNGNNTWTGTNIWQGNMARGGTTGQASLGVSSGTPILELTNGTSGTDKKSVELRMTSAGSFLINTLNEAASVARPILQADAGTTGPAVGSITIGNSTDNPTISGNGVDMTPSSATGTATLSTGLTTTPSTTFNIYKIGKMVTLRFMSSVGGTSNSTIRSFGVVVPAAMRPANQVCAGTIGAVNNGTSGYATVRVQANGTVDVGWNTDCSGASWTSSGSSTLNNFAVTYTTD